MGKHPTLHVSTWCTSRFKGYKPPHAHWFNPLHYIPTQTQYTTLHYIDASTVSIHARIHMDSESRSIAWICRVHNFSAVPKVRNLLVNLGSPYLFFLEGGDLLQNIQDCFWSQLTSCLGWVEAASISNSLVQFRFQQLSACSFTIFSLSPLGDIVLHVSG